MNNMIASNQEEIASDSRTERSCMPHAFTPNEREQLALQIQRSKRYRGSAPHVRDGIEAHIATIAEIYECSETYLNNSSQNLIHRLRSGDLLPSHANFDFSSYANPPGGHWSSSRRDNKNFSEHYRFDLVFDTTLTNLNIEVIAEQDSRKANRIQQEANKEQRLIAGGQMQGLKHRDGKKT